MKHRHKEAYCFVQYASKDGDEVETLWNSRDGLVPVGIPSANTGDHLLATGKLKYKPGHAPRVGERVIVDLTLARARMVVSEELDDLLQDPQKRSLLESAYESRDEAKESVAKGMLRFQYFAARPEAFGGEATPDILVVTAGFIEELLEARKVGAEPETTIKPDRAEGGDLEAWAVGFRAQLDPYPYYDRQGQKIGLDEWAQLSKDASYKILARTDVSKDVFVSTVWLGLDHGIAFNDEHRPVIFETMVFRRAPKPHMSMGTIVEFEGDEQERYCTEAEALAGHERMVAQERAALAGEARKEN